MEFLDLTSSFGDSKPELSSLLDEEDGENCFLLVKALSIIEFCV
jgi:hypothetical protein